jgi:hypothetical protein
MHYLENEAYLRNLALIDFAEFLQNTKMVPQPVSHPEGDKLPFKRGNPCWTSG